jgi:alpha/beta hydrolase fold
MANPRRGKTMTGQSGFRAPSRALLWSEQLRATAETVGYFAALPALTLGPSGDGHHVLVIPGLMASDTSTIGLRHVLRQRGYQAHGWRLGTNIGPTRHIHTGVVDRLAELADRGGAPVTIIGWSLGGIIARQLARIAPDQVRNVITLGSPFRLTLNDRPDVTHAHRIFEAFRPWHTDMLDTGHLPEDERPPLTVPSTAIYSRLDGVVPWQACMDVTGPQSESIEVTASHLGLGVHPQTLAIVLDRVGQPANAWQPYAASRAVAG